MFVKEKIKRRKRKSTKIFKRTKAPVPEVEPNIDKRTAKISEKFKEIEIKSAKSSDHRKHNNKSAKF